MSKGRVTIRDIAAAAGVSKSTVANALKDSPQNAPQTRERIRRIAKEMGYRSNPLVSAHFANVRRVEYSSGHKATLAYLADSTKEDVTRKGHPHYAAYCGARDRASELGFGLDVVSYQKPRLSADRIRKILKSRNIHGIVFAPHMESRAHLNYEWDCFSVALIGGAIVYPKYHRIEFDHLSNMEELFERLVVGSKDKVGLALPGAIDKRVRHQFRLAYGVLQEGRPDSLRVPVCIHEDWTKENVLGWYATHKPKVIVTVYDDVRRWLGDHGVKVPKDVRLLTPVTMADSQDYTGFRLSLESLGRAAVDSVAGQLYRNERGIPNSRKVTMLMGDWTTGHTA